MVDLESEGNCRIERKAGERYEPQGDRLAMTGGRLISRLSTTILVLCSTQRDSYPASLPLCTLRFVNRIPPWMGERTPSGNGELTGDTCEHSSPSTPRRTRRWVKTKGPTSVMEQITELYPSFGEGKSYFWYVRCLQ